MFPYLRYTLMLTLGPSQTINGPVRQFNGSMVSDFQVSNQFNIGDVVFSYSCTTFPPLDCLPDPNADAFRTGSIEPDLAVRAYYVIDVLSGKPTILRLEYEGIPPSHGQP
jgi:hypothetical protein